MKKNNYTAVSCQLHSELELLIMHGNRIKIELEKNTCRLKPHDLVTRKNKGEFLLGKDNKGQPIEIRLDQIKSWIILA
jgi:transcriptional antiterminator Rof (Rho-off)